MYQKFFTSTIISDFIKAFVLNTPISLLNVADDGDLIISGCRYIYRTTIIECTQTGYLFGNYTNSLYPDDLLFANNELFPNTGTGAASYKYVTDFNFGEHTIGITEKHKSNYSYYDPMTHKMLGEILRCIKSVHQINLLPFYNCFNHNVIDSFFITDEGIIDPTPDSAYKLYSVPIKFNQKYTIAIDCDSPVMLKSVLYGKLGLLRKGVSKNSPLWMASLQETSRLRYEKLNYKKPITYEIRTSDRDIMERQKYLQLVIRLPANNNSSITVLEGDYSTNGLKTFNKEYLSKMSPKELNSVYISPLGLLQLNDGTSYAFSDVLVQYLLLSVITPIDDIPSNIGYVQKLLLKLGRHNPRFVWEPTTQFTQKGIDISSAGNDPINMGIVPAANLSAYNEYTQRSWVCKNIHDRYFLKNKSMKTTSNIWDVHMRDIIFTYYRDYGSGPFLDINGFVSKEVEKELAKIDR